MKENGNFTFCLSSFWGKTKKIFFPLDTFNEFIEKKMRESIFAMLLSGGTEVYGRDMKLESR